MGIKSSFTIAGRSLFRRKTKNISAILAVTLGVTLLVGIQITTDTLGNAFLTSLLQGEGEVDLRITNSSGGYLKAASLEPISNLIPEAVGIMPELSTQIPALVGSQFDPKMRAVGISPVYPEAFGDFYSWTAESKLDLDGLLTDNSSVLLSSDQAEKLGLPQNTSLPVTLTTEFTNLTKIIIPPIVPLSEWMVNENVTSGEFILESSLSNLFLELEPVDFMSVVTIYTLNCPQLDLSKYGYINITTTGTPNAGVILAFFLNDGSTITVANLTDPATLNATTYDLTPYAGKVLRGEAYLSIASLNGTRASINITEIAFESPTLYDSTRIPIIEFTSENSRVELQIVGIFDSNRPGIGSQYSGAVFKLEHLQEWISLKDPERETDIISAFSVAYKTDHFILEIDDDYLRNKIELLEETIPKEINPETDEEQSIYQVNSARLDFFSFASFFITLINTILTSLGLLITLTGVLLITNIQLMSVEDREFQTGVLRAVGANRRGIFQSIMIENLFQGIIGGVLGLIGGLAFGQAVALYLVGLFGTGELSVQPVVSQETVVLSVIIGVVLSIITGILPALRASRVNIVEALRGIKVKFKAKSSRNLVALGVLMILAGTLILLYNGVFDEAFQVFWSNEGWDSLAEWRNLMMGFGLFTGGL
ncbi:MAG: ABC transporter permease, partial [Candidatus Bathyarchaeota archaeon]|nr:ABC transporter permease [Candidatus Bathyarchaeota archaeon]